MSGGRLCHIEGAAILRQIVRMRTLTTLPIIGLIAGSCLACPAQASSSAWRETDGGAVRLVTAGLPDKDGKLQGVLQIRLDPGWKTYWRDPGSSGVPPTLDIGTAGMVEMRYPAPAWHHDGQFDWAGYAQSVDFPVTLELTRAGPVDARTFIGLCETICIPLQADLTVDPASDPENPADVESVSAATARLPAPARPDFGISIASTTERELVLEAALPASGTAELFLAGEDGYQFGKPHLVTEGGKPVFRVKVPARPKARPGGEGLHYTLVTPTGAVSGILPYF